MSKNIMQYLMLHSEGIKFKNCPSRILNCPSRISNCPSRDSSP